MFEFWAMEHQLPPGGDWATWVILGGRGAGKTRAGSEWVRAKIEGVRPDIPGPCRRIALISETIDQARAVMVFGESGILECSPPARRPKWVESRKCLVWENGATAEVFSAHSPEALRGPQFDAAWLDEFAKWPKASATWENLQFCLRLGGHPQQLITTSPRNVQILKDVLAEQKTVVTHATTDANQANLPKAFLDKVYGQYANTRLGRQELDGILLDDLEGALWMDGMFAPSAGGELFDRIVVAVDPAVTHKEGSDACGIVVAGVVCRGPAQAWTATVIEDLTFHPKSPMEWANRVTEAFHRHQANVVVAEVNQGGALVETMLRQSDATINVQTVHAAKSKVQRAEPVAALYEQGRVLHRAGLAPLEAQMTQMTFAGYAGQGSPDRLDALVWALHELMLGPRARAVAPAIRVL